MKKMVIAALLMGASSMAMAEAPGGPNCGWGNMLFKGQSGMIPHFAASITNGTSGNATFGMTSGTNGCSTNGTLTYGGAPMIGMAGVLDEFIADAANGNGEAMNAVAVSMGISQADREVFAQVVHQNFNTIFPTANVTADQVNANLVNVMKADTRLAKYVS
ncbi:conserved hypothetical protein [gamma proteobacterium HdN1]|nr:conserved hypothetical protein [gamma proteobacterium HdN1]